MKYIFLALISFSLVLAVYLGFYHLTHQPVEIIIQPDYQADFEFIEADIQTYTKITYCGIKKREEYVNKSIIYDIDGIKKIQFHPINISKTNEASQ